MYLFDMSFVIEGTFAESPPRMFLWLLYICIRQLFLAPYWLLYTILKFTGISLRKLFVRYICIGCTDLDTHQWWKNDKEILQMHIFGVSEFWWEHVNQQLKKKAFWWTPTVNLLVLLINATTSKYLPSIILQCAKPAYLNMSQQSLKVNQFPMKIFPLQPERRPVVYI